MHGRCAEPANNVDRIYKKKRRDRRVDRVMDLLRSQSSVHHAQSGKPPYLSNLARADGKESKRKIEQEGVAE